MPELDAKGALLVAVWVLLNLLLNFFNKWALSPMVVELPCGNQGRHGLGASAAQAADWPRLAEARGSLRHDLALGGAFGEPAGRGLSRLALHTG